MPFVAEDSPALGPSLLAAGLRREGHATEVLYLHLPLAVEIGLAAYRGIDRRPDLLLGEWLFARALFGTDAPTGGPYVEELLQPALARGDLDEDLLARLPEIRRACEAFVERSIETIPWEKYDVVGFSSSFQQNTASLALARSIRARWPRVKILMGGANCEGEMGEALVETFGFLDHVFSGEGDLSLPSLLADLAADRPASRLVPGETVENLDALPIPDFADYFAALAASGLPLDPTQVRIPIETGRGCWWGEKRHCVFCGLNGTTMAFRRKSPERSLEEFRRVPRSYPTRRVWVADNILDPRAFGDLLPALAVADLGLDIFWEVKSNLKREQMEILARAGVRRVQPGIESLSTPVLSLMKKGVTALQNIRTLIYAKRHGVALDWNLLCGFPGEDPAEYERQAEILPALAHLTPPLGLFPVAVHRFAPLAHRDALRSGPAYRHVYPFPEDRLVRLAYFFEAAPPADLESYTARLAVEVDRWIASDARLTSHDDGETLRIEDTRPAARCVSAELRGEARRIYLACEDGAPERTLDSESALAPLLENRWILRIDGRCLALGIPS